jgi:hypothetical protein
MCLLPRARVLVVRFDTPFVWKKEMGPAMREWRERVCVSA